MQLRNKNPTPSLMAHQTCIYSSSKKSWLCVGKCLKALAQCASEKAGEIVGTMKKMLIMRRHTSFHLFLKSVMHPHVEHCVHFWLPHLKLGKLQWRANIMIKVMGQLPYEGKLKDWDNSGIWSEISWRFREGQNWWAECGNVQYITQ